MFTVCYWPWAPGFSRTVCVLPALLTQLGQVELSLQGHLQGASVDELQLHPQAWRGAAQTWGQFWHVKKLRQSLSGHAA